MLTPLPIDSLLPDIIAGLNGHASTVIIAEPGAGKSTRVPPAIADACNGQVLVLQPRRVAARAVAERIAWEHSWKIGSEVGYRIRFENRTSPGTGIVVMTEGILARQIQNDPFLDGVSAVIIDEFHERNLHTDVALALLREIQSSVRPDLKLIVMSATLDPGPVCCYLGDVPVHTATGRNFPLAIKHAARIDNRPLEIRTAEAITAAAQKANAEAPHILVFLPGMAEILRVRNNLPDDLNAGLHILHSSVDSGTQQAALAPSPRRKIILATNIAETSLTIDGVGCVIDTGLARIPVHDNRLGFDRLETRRISKASARQRAGRAGRSGPGVCLRMYTAEEHAALQDYDLPEIRRLDLAGTILLLKAYGVGRIEEFQWLESPDEPALLRAVKLLKMLDALDTEGHLTPWGKQISNIPLHPRLASVLLHGAGAGFTREVAWLCALLEAGDTTATVPQQTSHRESDPLDRLSEVLQKSSTATWAVKNAAGQLERLASAATLSPAATGDRDSILRQALLRGFPDRLVTRRSAGNQKGVMVGQRGVRLAASSTVLTARLYVAIDLREREGDTESLVQAASAVEREWLPELLPGLWEEKETVRVVGHKIQGVRQSVFAGLVLDQKELGRLPAGIEPGDIIQTQLLSKYSSPAQCLYSVPDVQAWLGRYQFLQFSLSDLDLPDPDFQTAFESACSSCRILADFSSHALSCLQMILPGAARLVNDLAPEYLSLPTGNRARIHYPVLDPESGKIDSAASPYVSARVQELFGLADSPKVANGRVMLTIELLSPAMRPVQKTKDLRSFWNGAYQEVRKELRARYPKHPWPEDPWTAQPVSIGRRRS